MNKKSATFYNRFSWFYPLIDAFLMPQKRVLFSEVNHQPHGKLLEIGVGNGSHFHLYKRHKVTGIDTSAEMIHNAGNRESNVELMQMDGEALLFENETFDYVVLSHVLAVTDNPEKLLEEVARVVKPNGKIFILNHFTPNNWLKYLDYAFGYISKWLHFRSVFHINDLKSIQNFIPIKEVGLGPLSYFKLLIYLKK